jgi:hypothetical protein
MSSGKVFKGACHCRAVRFEVKLKSGLDQPIRCNCSICRMRGAVLVMARREDLRVVEGEEALTEYRFNTGVAQYFFCSKCGVYTHHQRRFVPTEFAVNAACLEGVSPYDFTAVPVIDGANHPHDTGGSALLTVGVLTLEPASGEQTP